MLRFFKMPPQIIRLVLLTIGIVCAYFAARYFLVPQSFGEFGHYRGIALQEIAARQPVLGRTKGVRFLSRRDCAEIGGRRA